jgi:adenine C2-methylase RlmN of 23S rRNA A2503 and tRNA A37
MIMTEEEVKRAFDVCEAAFWLYVKQAKETHRMLSLLSGEVSVEVRAAVAEQRLCENEAQALYSETRVALFRAALAPQ